MYLIGAANTSTLDIVHVISLYAYMEAERY